MTINEIIVLSCSIISLGAAVYLLTKSRLNANIWLALLLAAFAFQLFYNVLYWSNVSPVSLVVLKYSYMFPMTLYGPAFYFYVRSLVTRKKMSYIDLLHCIWPAIFFVMFWGYYTLPLEAKQTYFANDTTDDHIIDLIPQFDWFLTLVMLGYIIGSAIIYGKALKKEPDLLLWVKTVHVGFALYAVSFMVYFALFHVGLITLQMDYFISYIMMALVFGTLYFCYQYPRIFNGEDINKVIPFVKYNKSGLSDSFSLELKQQLLALMQDNKPYLDCTLRLNDLADALNISRNHMSQVINEHFNASFFEFINHYRVQNSLELLKSDTDLSITDIAFESGFNNRVSFYKTFKREVGETPTEYRNKLNKAS